MDEPNSVPSPRMSVVAHVRELRRSLFSVAIVFAIFSSLGYMYRNEILAMLKAPLEGHALHNFTIGGAFTFVFQVVMWVGIAAALPVLMLAIYKFVAPALPKGAQAKSFIIFFSSLVLLACGVLFGYFFAIPGAIRFLLDFGAESGLQDVLTADAYLNFVLAYTIGLGVLFQLPLLLVIINWIKPLKPGKLMSFERYVIVLSFIAAAIITPTPDVVNQTVIALPVIIMYQGGVLAVMGSQRRARKKQRKLHAVIASSPSKQQPIAVPKPVVSLPKEISTPSLGASSRTSPNLQVVRREQATLKMPNRPRRSIDGISRLIPQ